MSQTRAHARQQLCMLKSREAEWGRTARRDGALMGRSLRETLCAATATEIHVQSAHLFSRAMHIGGNTHAAHAYTPGKLPVTPHFHVDTLGIEPRASRMLSGCDTTTPHALDHKPKHVCIISPSESAPGKGTSPKSSTCLEGGELAC